MALRVGPRGLEALDATARRGCGLLRLYQAVLREFLDATAVNNQLRTGADKGNPTV